MAVLGARMRHEEGVRCYVSWTCHQVMRGDPEALAGSLDNLLESARLIAEGYLRLPSLCLPLVVFSTLKSGVMAAGERDLLWQAYGLPFYEQIRDGAGRLLAYECDARNGFHWVGEDAASRLHRPGLCACGRTPTGRRAAAKGYSAAR